MSRRRSARTIRPRLAVLAAALFSLCWLPGDTLRATGVPISLPTAGTAYMQDFNTLATSGTANTLLPTGWGLAESGTSSRNNSAYAASTGSDFSGDVYSFGPFGNTERAFGTLRSGTLVPIVGACFNEQHRRHHRESRGCLHR